MNKWEREPVKSYFRKEEFQCSCCGREEMESDFLFRLALARSEAGVPFVINSGWRCVVHNRDPNVGGSPDSSHKHGCAADIRARDSVTRFKIIRALLLAGFNRIGVRKDFIHADSDRDKPSGVVWLY
jgi:zinc D-Ala-D-Ala carboxypeptidase